MYHQRTYDLLRLEPRASVENLKVLDRLEAVRGIKLPAAVREWYSLAGIDGILREVFGDQHPQPLQELGQAFDDWYGSGPKDLLTEQLLYLAAENQGVCNWVLPLAQGEDPPVLVERNSAPHEIWQPFADTFSTFIYCMAFDNADWDPEADDWYAETYDPLDGQALAYLGCRLYQEPSTYNWPARVTYRYSRGGVRIYIWNGDKQADWTVMAPSSAALAAVSQELQPLWVWTG